MRDVLNAQKITFSAARQNNNLSQSEVAEMLGVSKDTVEQYERSGKVPYDHAILMLKIYGISSVHIYIE